MYETVHYINSGARSIFLRSIILIINAQYNRAYLYRIRMHVRHGKFSFTSFNSVLFSLDIRVNRPIIKLLGNNIIFCVLSIGYFYDILIFK